MKKSFLFVVLGYLLIFTSFGQGCENAYYICPETGTFSYPVGVGSGDVGTNIGCLQTTPNPRWLFLQVGQAGRINIHMWATPTRDFDFAAWGPFTASSFEELVATDICNQLTVDCWATCDTTCISHSGSAGANPSDLGIYPCGNLIDCSYEASLDEYIHLPDAVIGDYYILLVTNYSNQATYINISIDPTSSGSTGCMEGHFIGDTVCVGETASLSYENPPSFATFTFEGPNGFYQSSLSPEVVIPNVQLANAGLYTLVITPSGGFPQSTLTSMLVVKPLPSTPFIIQNNSQLQSSAASGNQWYNQDGIISGATDQNYTVTENGEYFVIVSLFGCNSEPSPIINIINAEIEMIVPNKLIKIFPNPVLDQLVIEFEGNQVKLTFEIINITGQVVYKGDFIEKTIVQTSSFATGSYLINIENGEKFEFKKIVKQ